MKRLRLSSGLELYGLNQTDCEVLYQQIFGTASYLKHGIALSDGDCVFDVGANVGLFSIWLASRYRALDLYLFEPAPEAFRALEQNRVLLGPSRSKLFQAAVSDHPGEGELIYCPPLSSMAALSGSSSAAVAGSLQHWLRAVVADARATPPLPLLPQWAARSEALAFTAAVASAASIAAVRAVTTRKTKVPLTTLSNVIRDEQVGRIDLLKVDVEGHELQVLRGIEAPHWERVRQLVIEVADVGGQLIAVTRLLEEKGYRVTVDQEPWELFKVYRLHNVYARK